MPISRPMDEKDLQRRLTELFLRLGYEAEARSLAGGDGTSYSLVSREGVRIEVQASPPADRASRRRPRR